jgi:hypothetical protein
LYLTPASTWYFILNKAHLIILNCLLLFQILFLWVIFWIMFC